MSRGSDHADEQWRPLLDVAPADGAGVQRTAATRTHRGVTTREEAIKPIVLNFTKY